MQQSAQKVIDDGLYTPSIGIWATRKYELLSYYSSLFATSMLKKWDCRIYIDLFSGPGRGKVKRSNEIILTSPLLAIEIQDKFDKYIYCNIDQKCMSALRKRIAGDYSKINVEYILGDTNENVTDVLKAIPTLSRSYKVLSFCFVDPFNMNSSYLFLITVSLSHLKREEKIASTLTILISIYSLPVLDERMERWWSFSWVQIGILMRDIQGPRSLSTLENGTHLQVITGLTTRGYPTFASYCVKGNYF